MTFTPNPDGIRKMYEEIGRKIEGADKRIRSEHTDSSVEDVEKVAASRFGALGVNLPPAKVREYAEAVVADKPFKFVLQ